MEKPEARASVVSLAKGNISVCISLVVGPLSGGVSEAVLLPGVCRHRARRCAAVSPPAALGQPGTEHQSLYCTLCTVLVAQALCVSSAARLDSKRDQSLITGKVQ